jgi:hypothetical protein
MKGAIENYDLVKKGKQVVKFWKYGGYAVPVSDLDKVRGVKLYTQYDGILYAPRNVFYAHGIPNNFNGEQQLVLPTNFWETLHA